MSDEPTSPPDDAVPSAEELLDALPYGIVVLDGDCVVVRSSAPARSLVPALTEDRPARCSDLFSCSAAGGPCEHECFIGQAMRSRRAHTEVRIDSAGGASPGALWVTSTALPDGRGAILHLRPGARGDRRRRSEERLQPEPLLRILTLGRTRVESAVDTLESAWLSQKPGQILKYLVCERQRVVMVDEIAEAIWPDSGARTVSNTRYAIHRLRGKLEPRREPHGAPAFVVARGGGYALDRERVWVDVDDFERELELGRTAMLRLADDGAAEHLERAVALYGGPFMADEPYAHWAVDERNRLAGMAIYALRVLTALARTRNDGADALRHLQRLAELEPLDRGVHRELVQALLGEGRPSEAKRRYESFARRVHRELGAAAGFDLRSLNGRPPPAADEWTERPRVWP